MCSISAVNNDKWQFEKSWGESAKQAGDKIRVTVNAPGETLKYVSCLRMYDLENALPIWTDVSGESATVDFYVWKIVGENFEGTSEISCHAYTTNNERVAICTTPKATFTQH